MKKDFAEQKAKELVAKMTLEEAASQLLYVSPAIERLGIPAYNWWNEALHGVARAGTATMFPQAIGLAAMFDEETLKRAGEVIGTEARAKFNEQSQREDRDIFKGVTLWSPNINIFRDPRWGRGQETYGEDPFLTSRLGCAFVKGLQGEGEYLVSAACAKHFAVHSGPESTRHSFDAKASGKDMEETYLPAFEALVKEAKVEGVMGAYNRLNGECCCASEFLSGKLKEWGFEGYYVSDFLAIRDFYRGHGVCENATDAAAKALKAGIDCNAGNTYQNLMEAYRAGAVTEAEIRTACEHLFRTRYRLGLFEKEDGFSSLGIKDVATKEHRVLSYDCARKSIVLLQNNGILPLDRKKLSSVAVIGPNADSIDALRGNYYGTPLRNTTFLEGIMDACGEDIRVYHGKGSALLKKSEEFLAKPDDRLAEAAAMVSAADVTILCLGLDASVEGEEGDEGNAFEGGDKTTLELPECQRHLLDTVLAVNKPVIVVLASGSSLHPHAEKADAVLETWYPGELGGKALADILFGEVSPSGKLPVTFYESAEKLPDFSDYSMQNRTYRYTRTNTLYPFGFGLTYGDTAVTSVAYSEGRVIVTAENRGTYDTEDVIELYIRDVNSPFEVPYPRLCGFKRVFLKAKERITVELVPDEKAFTVVDNRGCRIPGSGTYSLEAGFCSPGPVGERLTGKKPVSIRIERKEQMA